MKVAAYIRVSTEEQAQEGYSIDAQKARITKFATEKKWIVNQFYVDEGISGKNLERPEVQKLIRDITDKKVDVLIVYRSDRLTRDLEDMLSLTRLFQKFGVQLISLTEEIRLQTASDRFLHNVTSAVSQYEREKISENVKIGMEQLATTGYRPGGTYPYGYTETDHVLSPVPEQTEVVNEIFELYAKGTAVRTICKILNDKGIVTGRGAKWTGKPLQYILTNPVYIGKIRWDSVLVDGKHEAIISQELWDRVQNEFKRRKKLAPRFQAGVYPFSSVLKCGYCGKNMHIHHGAKHFPFTLYVCRTKECTQIQIKEESVEKIFLDEIKVISNQDYWDKKISNDKESSKLKSKLKKIEKELEQLEPKKKRWFEAFESHVIDLSMFKERIEQLKSLENELVEQKESLEDELRRTNTAPSVDLLNYMAKIEELWNVATKEEKKRIINGIIEHIDLYLLPEFENVERAGKSVKGLRKEIKHRLGIKLKL